MNAGEYPLYVSKANVKSFWNEYRIYNDRIELHFWHFAQTFVIPFNELISIDIYKPPVIRTTFWALKLDWADFNEHVGIERRSGKMKKIRFTPNDPKEFIAKVKEYKNI